MPDPAQSIEGVDVARIIFWAWFILTGVVLAVIDARTHRLPRRLVGLTLAVAIVLAVVIAAWVPDPGLVVRAFLASGTLVLVYLALHLGGGMGMGDVTYASVVGLYLGSIGWTTVWWGTLAAFLIASVWAAGCQVASGIDRRRGHAFGPAMVLGAVLVAGWSAMEP
jgi:leader peptidase (prepilin peptidase)/N-methyltransferase